MAGGFRRFGKGDAEAMFDEARTFAEKNRLHQVAFEIEEAMSKAVQTQAIERSAELTEIAEVLEHLRDTASLGVSEKTINAEQ